MIRQLMKLAAESGKAIPENEAIARINDKFYNEVFSGSLPPASEATEAQIKQVLAEWLDAH